MTREGFLPWSCSLPPHTLPSLCSQTAAPAHLSDLLEPVRLQVGEDVALGLGEDLEGHGAVVVLQGGDVIVADGQLCAGVDLVPGTGGEGQGASGAALGGTCKPGPHTAVPEWCPQALEDGCGGSGAGDCTLPVPGAHFSRLP